MLLSEGSEGGLRQKGLSVRRRQNVAARKNRLDAAWKREPVPAPTRLITILIIILIIIQIIIIIIILIIIIMITITITIMITRRGSASY